MGRTNKPNTVAAEAARKRSHPSKRPSKSPRETVAAGRGSKKAEPTQKKAHRFRAGTVALREVRRYQRSTETLLRVDPFVRLVRHLASGFKGDLRFQASALRTLQDATEQEFIAHYEAAQVAAVHAHRVTIDHRDLNTARLIRNALRGPVLGASPTSSTIPFEGRARVTKTKVAAPAAAADEEAATAEQEVEEAANVLVQAVAQEQTVNAPADAPDTPDTDVPTVATPSRTGRKAHAAPAPVPQFDDNDMSVFA